MIIKLLFTLCIGAVGGAVAFALGLPIPWLLGSVLSVSLCQFYGLRLVRPHLYLDRVMRVLLGVSLGASVAANVSVFSLQLLTTIVIALLLVLLIVAVGSLYFRRLSGFATIDGFLAALPGGFSALIAISGDLGNRFPKIALIHTVRVVVLVFTFSFLAFLLHADQVELSWLDTFSITEFSQDSFVLSWSLVVLTLVCGVIAQLSGVAGAHVLFSLLITSVVYYLGWVQQPMPEVVKTMAMITFGSLLGYELSKNPEGGYWMAMRSSVFFTVAVMLVALFIAIVLSYVFDTSYLLFLLAFAPGGIAEISLITLALGFDVGFVACVHACRFAFIMMVGPIGLNISKRKNK